MGKRKRRKMAAEMRRLIATSPTLWFVELEIARKRGDAEHERRALEKLRSLGVQVIFGGGRTMKPDCLLSWNDIERSDKGTLVHKPCGESLCCGYKNRYFGRNVPLPPDPMLLWCEHCGTEKMETTIGEFEARLAGAPPAR